VEEQVFNSFDCLAVGLQLHTAWYVTAEHYGLTRVGTVKFQYLNQWFQIVHKIACQTSVKPNLTLLLGPNSKRTKKIESDPKEAQTTNPTTQLYCTTQGE
jgi:hypothetical protein